LALKHQTFPREQQKQRKKQLGSICAVLTTNKAKREKQLLSDICSKE